MTKVLLAAAAASLALSACAGSAVEAPAEQGVCYHLGNPYAEGEEPRWNELARDQQSLEYCAARLEIMRRQFLGLGGSTQEVVGAYGGKFLFVDRAGVSTANSLDGGRFFALARTGDGRLAIPGIIPQAPEDVPAGG